MAEPNTKQTPTDPGNQLKWDDPEYQGPALQWTCHPMKRKPLVTLLVTFFITIVGLVVYYWTGSKWFAVFGVLIVFASLAKFYFPTSYRMTDRGFMIKTSTQTLAKFWSNFRSVYPDRNGVLISPFSAPSRLENFRGVYIMFNNNRNEVLSFVKEHIGVQAQSESHAETPDGSEPEGETPA